MGMKSGNQRSNSYHLGSGYHGSREVNILVQQDGGFGFTIDGGLENGDKLPILELDFKVNFKGKLSSGDVILTVNGAKVVGRKSKDVEAMLQSFTIGSTKNFTIEILSCKEHGDGKNY